jgi:hypothetical protein
MSWSTTLNSVAPPLFGEPEQVGGEPRWELRGEVVHHLEAAALGHRGQQLVDARGQERGVVLHGPGREAATHEAALRKVLRVVQRDRVRLFLGDVRPVRTTRREHITPSFDVDDIGMPGDDPVAVGVAVHR